MTGLNRFEAYDLFAKTFPAIELRRGVRFVDNKDVATAAGGTSGIELPLLVASRYAGRETMKSVADYLEHDRSDW